MSYLSEAIAELKKVTWLKRDEVIKLLSLVIAVSLVVSIFVGGIDFGLTKLLERLVSR